MGNLVQHVHESFFLKAELNGLAGLAVHVFLHLECGAARMTQRGTAWHTGMPEALMPEALRMAHRHA